MSSFSHPFRLTWKIEVFNRNIFKGDRPLESAFFRIESLRNTRWNLKLLSEGTGDEDWIICELKNGCGFGDPETIYLNYRLYVNVGRKRHFERVGSLTKYGSGCYLRVPFIHAPTLNNTHYPNGTLVVVCEMAPCKVRDPFCVAENLKRLSKDTAVLHISRQYSDLILSTDDHQMFEVHKFVIYSRWKEAISMLRPSENESNVGGVPGSVFGRFLRYLYSGKLSSRNVSLELFEFASQNCEDLRRSLRSLSNALSMCSRFKTQRMVLKFRLSSWKSLSQVVSLIGIYSPELQINIDACEQTAGECLSISFWFSDFQLDQPIYLRCNVLLVEGTESGSRWSATKQHIFVRGEEWRFPSFIRKSDFARLLSLQLVLTLDIGDRMLPTTVETSLTEFRTGSRGVYDLHSLARDFHQASKETSYKDVIVITGSVAFLRHKAMLGARSSVFRNLLERNTFIEDIQTINISPLDYVSVMHFLEYIYSGSISHLSHEEVYKLRCLSELFCMHKLEESCCIFLASNSNRF